MDLPDILVEVLDRSASDLHITVGVPPMIRVKGNLETVQIGRLSIGAA